MIKSLDHVGITVKDLDKAIDWYVANLGFSVGRRMENKERGTRIAFLSLNGRECLELFGFYELKKAVEGPALKAEETGIKHIALSVDNMEETCKKLKSEGAEFTTQLPERSVFKDPNGIVIELRLS